jgi:hypothetical protein
LFEQQGTIEQQNQSQPEYKSEIIKKKNNLFLPFNSTFFNLEIRSQTTQRSFDPKVLTKNKVFDKKLKHHSNIYNKKVSKGALTHATAL